MLSSTWRPRVCLSVYDRIIELAAVKMRDGEVIGAFEAISRLPFVI